MDKIFIGYNLPCALQWQRFLHVGILFVPPIAVEGEYSPQHNVPIFRQLRAFSIPSPPAHWLLSLRERHQQQQL